MVPLAFVDESERDDRYYFLGALIIEEWGAELLRHDLDGVVARFAWTFPDLFGVELHGSTMMRAHDEPWRSVPLRARFAIYDAALKVIHESGAQIYIEGVDIEGQRARGYPVLTPARQLAFSHLYERINECWREGQPLMHIIADEHHTAETSRSNFARYRVNGTYGYRSSHLLHVDPDISFIGSHTDRALQAADLITYLYNRVQTVREHDQRALRRKNAMWKMIEENTTPPHGRARIWP